jgi:hypothetical protein
MIQYNLHNVNYIQERLESQPLDFYLLWNVFKLQQIFKNVSFITEEINLFSLFTSYFNSKYISI